MTELSNFLLIHFNHLIVDRFMILHSLVSSGLSDQQMLILTENYLNCQKWSPYKVKGVFSMQLVHPFGAIQGLSTASQNRYLAPLQNIMQWNPKGHPEIRTPV